MDIHIELQDTDARFSLFASSTYELAFGGLSVHMNADQFQQLCDNLRPWVVEDTTPQPSADAVREVPDGMVLVPREPTEAMKAAGAACFPNRWGNGDATDGEDAADCYREMLSAASGEKGVGNG